MCVMYWVVRKLDEEEEVFIEESALREQPWMRHETHQMTKLFSGAQR